MQRAGSQTRAALRHLSKSLSTVPWKPWLEPCSRVGTGVWFQLTHSLNVAPGTVPVSHRASKVVSNDQALEGQTPPQPKAEVGAGGGSSGQRLSRTAPRQGQGQTWCQGRILAQSEQLPNKGCPLLGAAVSHSSQHEEGQLLPRSHGDGRSPAPTTDRSCPSPRHWVPVSGAARGRRGPGRKCGFATGASGCRARGPWGRDLA